jgi:hypothetical protein
MNKKKIYISLLSILFISYVLIQVWSVKYDPYNFLPENSNVFKSQRAYDKHIWNLQKVLEFHDEAYSYTFLSGNPARLSYSFLVSFNNEKIKSYVKIACNEKWITENITEEFNHIYDNE